MIEISGSIPLASICLFRTPPNTRDQKYAPWVSLIFQSSMSSSTALPFRHITKRSTVALTCLT